MKIRNKLLIYFSTTVIALSATSLIIIYLLFSEYREEEFQQQQNKKIKYTIGLIVEFKQMSEELSLMMDAQDIHDFYDEKLLIFNTHKELIFSSLDSLPIASTNKILNNLSPSNDWIETKEDNYDLIGVYVEKENKTYYAVSKAFDAFGYSKLYFLRNILIVIFVATCIVVILLTLYLSNIISKPITKLSEKLNKYDITTEAGSAIEIDTSSFELQHLTKRFNELIDRTNEAFVFQKNAIHHISHELKTPVAILMSELERMKTHTNIDKLKSDLDDQINQAKSLGEIINVFLEISKIEAGQEINKQSIRIDEVLFDLMEELKLIAPHFNFELNYFPVEFEESKIKLKANEMLIKQAFQNLLMNCINYSSNQKAQILIDCSQKNKLNVAISNKGKTVAKAEEKHLFNHSFRGKNSQGKAGFGLGLVVAQKIIAFHGGSIFYSNPIKELNEFTVEFHFKEEGKI